MFTAGGGDALLVTAGGIGVRVNDLTAATTVKALASSLNVTGTGVFNGAFGRINRRRRWIRHHAVVVPNRTNTGSI
jgi:hypothetical protein